MLQEGLKTEVGTLGAGGLRTLWVRLILVVLLISASAGGAYWYWSKNNSGSDWQKKTVPVKRGQIDVRVIASGVIKPFNQVKISPKVTGLLKKLLVQQGEYVHRGQVLAIMDDSNLIGQVQAARGAHLAAKANCDKAIHGNRPQEVLASRAFVSRAESMVRNAEQAVGRCQTLIQSANAQVLRDETNAKRLSDLAVQGAISDQERLNAVTQAKISRALLDQYQRELKQQESVLSQSKAELDSARQQYSMMKDGYRFEDRQAAQMSLVQAEGNLKFLESQLNDTKIKAPFDGVVTQKYTDEGAIVTPTTSAATTSATSSSIISLAGRLELVAAVAETDMDRIKLGQSVEIVANAFPERMFHGKVNLIAPEAIINQNVTTFEVHATIDDDPSHLLMSGMNVNAEFLAGIKANALLIPTACIMSKQGKTGVLVPNTEGEPHFKAVKIGPTCGTSTEVLDGLKDGTRVFLGLTKSQLEEQGFAADTGKMPGRGGMGFGGGGGGGSQPQIPRGFGHSK